MVETPLKTLEKMIQFGIYINTNFKHFPIRALEGIQNFFGYNTTVYTILNLKPDGEVYISDIFSSMPIGNTISVRIRSSPRFKIASRS